MFTFKNISRPISPHDNNFFLTIFADLWKGVTTLGRQKSVKMTEIHKSRIRNLIKVGYFLSPFEIF